MTGFIERRKQHKAALALDASRQMALCGLGDLPSNAVLASMLGHLRLRAAKGAINSDELMAFANKAAQLADEIERNEK